MLRFADVELDPSTRLVHRGGDPIELTRTEFALLELFLLNPRQVLTRSVIFERVWGYDFGFGSNSLDVYIGYLRRKTEQGGKPRLIQTIRGVGYALARGTMELPRAPDAGRRRPPWPWPWSARPRSRTRSCATSCASQVDETLQIARARPSPASRVIGDPGGEQFLGLRPERFGGVAVFTQLVSRDGEAITPPGRRASCRSRSGRSRPHAARSTSRSTRTRTSRARTSACSRSRSATATRSRSPARSRRSTASSAKIRRWLIALALVGIALAAGLGLLVARAVLAPVQRLTRAAEDVSRDARSLAADRRLRHGRALAPRRDVQHDARRARGLGARAAAARLRRVARAANAADEPAHEHRGARARRGAAAATSASSCSATSPSS